MFSSSQVTLSGLVQLKRLDPLYSFASFIRVQAY